MKEQAIHVMMEKSETGTKEVINIDCNIQSIAPKPANTTTGDTTNQSRLEQMISGPCTDLLRAILTVHTPPSDLLNQIPSLKKTLDQHYKNQCKEVEKKLKRDNDYSDFDITLLYFVLRNLCGFEQEFNRRMSEKTPSGETVIEIIEKLRKMKNDIKSHKPNNSTSLSDYESQCDDIVKIVQDLNKYSGNDRNYKRAVCMLKIVSMDPDERKHLEGNIEEIKDRRLTWIEMITSKELANLFRSFNVCFGMDYQRCSFDCKDLLENLKGQLTSLSEKVVLTKEGDLTTDAKLFRVLVFEVKVHFDEKEYCVLEKGYRTKDFFEANDNHQARVIFITSNYISIVKAKLAVYRKYRDAIKDNNIFLHHEFEDIDEVAKFTASERLSSYCDFFESAIHSLKENDYIENKPKGKSFRTLEIDRRWRDWVDKEVLKMAGYEQNCSATLDETKQRDQNLEKELTKILRQLQEFKAKILPTDQNELIEECRKGEIVRNSSELRRNKNFAMYIVGHRGDKNPVAKVFLRKDDEEDKQLFKRCCNVLEGMTFEYVNLENYRPEDEQMIKSKTAIDVTNRTNLREFVLGNTDQIMARYSTITGVDMYQDEKKGPLGIVLYILDSTLIPFGEKPLPTDLGGWPCIFKEGLAVLKTGCNICKCSEHIKAGCSIGIPFNPESGSVGFFVEPKESTLNTFEFGFLTASHVAVADFQNLYQKLLSDHPLSEKKHPIVHPSWEDGGGTSNEVGEVFESFIGNYGPNENGLDLAVVKLNNVNEEGKKETLEVVKEDDLNIGERIKVMKCGKSTGTTYGTLSSCNFSVRVSEPLCSDKYFIFKNCYAVINNKQEKPFLGEGDSGSGVFVVDQDKALGIAFLV